MSTHRRAWKQRAGVVAALLVGALLTVPASPASAAPVVSKVSASPSRVEAGGSTTISYSIEASADDPAKVRVTSSNGKLTCATGCERDVDQNGNFQATFRLADDAADGESTITVTAEGDDGDGIDTTTVTLVGKPKPQPSPTQPPQPQTVKSVSGEVVNQNTGSAVPGAQVVLQDSENNRFDTSTDNGGNFRFTGSTQNPIAPGQLVIGASIDDFTATKTLNASTGQSVSGQRISLKIEAPTPSPTASSSIEPAPTVGVEEQTDEPVEAAVDTPVANADNEESGGIGSLLIILLGGLLVAAGVGTMVLLWLRRKETDDEDEADATPSGAATGAVPVARGSYGGTDDQTRIVNPTAAAPTMVGGGDPALAEAPTMMHSPVIDDVPPDPYGAPPQPYNASVGQSSWADSGYGATSPASGGGYGATPPASGGGYGATDYGMSSSAGTGYPAASGGSAGYDDRYDEATGRYQTAATQYPAPADPYPTGRYQQDAGYSQTEPAYGQGAEPASGYDQRGGYGGYGYDQQGGYNQEPPAQHGGYNQEAPAQHGGYDDRGYGQGGYSYDQQGSYHQEPPAQYGGYNQEPPAQHGGYNQEPPAQHGGYDDRGYGQGGYDDRGGYGQGGYGGGYGDPTQADRARSDAPPPDRGGRRLDWLDD